MSQLEIPATVSAENIFAIPGVLNLTPRQSTVVLGSLLEFLAKHKPVPKLRGSCRWCSASWTPEIIFAGARIQTYFVAGCHIRFTIDAELNTDELNLWPDSCCG